MERDVVYEYTQGEDHPFLELLHYSYGLIGVLCFILCPIGCILDKPFITSILWIIACTITYTFDKIDIEKSVTIKEVLSVGKK